MVFKATPVELSVEDKRVLESWIRSTKTQHRRSDDQERLALRARMILAAANGQGTNSIAKEVKVNPRIVSKWRIRFARQGMAGLQDAPRPGAPRRYDEATEQRILKKLDDPPPVGHATWTGKLLANALGDISPHQVWRVLRRHRIHLRRRRSWCISRDPEFAAKAADIVGLYLNPPENAVVLSVDEKPGIQALERAQGYLKLPDGRAITGYSHEYKRHGTTTLFAALSVATGEIEAAHYNRHRRREFLDFMNQLVAQYTEQEVHVTGVFVILTAQWLAYRLYGPDCAQQQLE